jgi:hypothetical protein
MGHMRFGLLPRTRKWREVVELIAVGADVPQIADATIRAAEAAFSYVNDDCGYNQAVWLLTQLGLAAKDKDPVGYLRTQGVDIAESTSVADIAVALTSALDNYSVANGGHSALGDLAQRALIDAVVQKLEHKLQQQTLFNLQAEETCRALSDFGKEKEFGQLARAFYSRLTREGMNYFLSQTLATQLGAGQRFATMDQKAQFDAAIETHCREASAIVEKFSGEWFSKHRYEENGYISRNSIQGFASYALKKMTDELKMGAKANEQ